MDRVGEGKDDGARVERRHGLDDVLCERVLQGREQDEGSARTRQTLIVLRPSSAVGLTWWMMSTKLVSFGPS